jgi:hypothetical protein
LFRFSGSGNAAYGDKILIGINYLLYFWHARISDYSKRFGDDGDWQLYDITGRNPDDVFTVNSLVVIGNWSGSCGLTGASSSGVNYTQCFGSCGQRTTVQYHAYPTGGHEYLLLISHFTGRKVDTHSRLEVPL